MTHLKDLHIEYGEKFSVGRREVQPVYVVGQNKKTNMGDQLSVHLIDGEPLTEDNPHVAKFLSEVVPIDWSTIVDSEAE